VMLYNVEDDPEELNDISGKEPVVLNEMLGEAKAALEKADAPYL